jgi:surface protein
MKNVKLLTVKNREVFDKRVDEIPSQSISFIKDSLEIYANGQMFNSVDIQNETVSLLPNKSTKLGAFNGKSLTVKVADVEGYEYGDDLVINSKIKSQLFLPEEDASIRFDANVKLFGIYNVLIAPMADVKISVPIDYICKEYTIDATTDQAILLKINILPKGDILVEVKHLKGYSIAGRSYRITQSHDEMPVMGGIMQVDLSEDVTIDHVDADTELYSIYHGSEQLIVPENTDGKKIATHAVTINNITVNVSFLHHGPQYIEMKYVADSTNNSIFGNYTNILYNNFDRFYIDGVETTRTNKLEAGEHTVRVIFKDQTYSFYNLFYGVKALVSIDFSNFDGSNVTSVANLCYNCTNLKYANLSNFQAPLVTGDSYGLFNRCTSLEEVVLDGFDLPNAETISSIFYNCKLLKSVDFRSFTSDKITSMSSVFYYCESATSILLPELKCSNLSNFNSAFAYCKSLTSIDLSVFDLSGAGIMERAFIGCTNVKTIYFGGKRTAGFTSAYYGFYGCTSLEYTDYFKLRLPNLTTAYQAFYKCNALNMSDFRDSYLPALTNASSMFYDCTSLTSVDFSNSDLSSLQTMSSMFAACTSLKSVYFTNVYNNTVTTMGSMFSSCTVLSEFDMLGFDTSNVTSFEGMFNYCSSLVNVELRNFTLNGTLTKMFYNCFNVKAIRFGKDISTTSTKTNMFGLLANAVYCFCPISYWSNYANTIKSLLPSNSVLLYPEDPDGTTHYRIDLNDQWRVSETENTNAPLVDGIYESFSNHNINSQGAEMYVYVKGLTRFILGIRGSSQGFYDYVMASKANETITNDTEYNDDAVKASTRGYTNSYHYLTNYIFTVYTGLDPNVETKITILYKKNSYGHENEDRGYLIIPQQ